MELVLHEEFCPWAKKSLLYIKKSHSSGKLSTASAKSEAFDLSAYPYFVSMPNYTMSITSSSFRKHVEYEKKNWHIIKNYLKEKGQNSKKKLQMKASSWKKEVFCLSAI